jgi:methylenetetrahydrofolate reductase (NADPH)
MVSSRALPKNANHCLTIARESEEMWIVFSILNMSIRTTHPLNEMLRYYSLELTPGDTRLIAAAIERLHPRTVVSLTWIPGSNPMDMIVPAARLRRAGLLVMPHICARHLRSRAELDQLAERLVGEAGVERVLIVGGDRTRPAGPFSGTLEVMRAGVFQRVGIRRIGVAGFPEGNPHISGMVLDEALAAKLNFSRREGLQLSIVTQLCFSSESIIAWLRRLRERGIEVPVRIGLAGPANLITLLRYAVRCGIGNSMHVLSENPSFAKALVDRGPEPIIYDIAESIEGQNLGIAGLHFYLFGGLSRTLDWIAAVRSRKPAFV